MLRSLATSLVLLFPSTLWSEVVTVAVASNFAAPMRLIESAFESQTGHELQVSYGSSGSLYAQIVNGAPFGVFLSADQATVDTLETAELLVDGSRFTYAVGALLLWSANADLIDDDINVLVEGGFEHLSIANPVLAPYGQAAVDVLNELGLYEQSRARLVMGENISQTYQFVATGSAELGFVALSQVMESGQINRGSYWLVPRDLYPPILQDAALLNNAENNVAASDFVEFMRSGPAAQIIRSFGYLLLASD